LTVGDLKILAAAGMESRRVDDAIRSLRSDPQLVEQLLGRPAVFDRLFGGGAGEDPILVASPFLVFAVMMHRGAAELNERIFVVERTARGSRLPVFDVAPLRSFLADPSRRLFLVELLGSYTRVQSGTVWVRSTKGWRKHRFSELDPLSFAALLDMVSELERPGIYRRLGDVALFLSGVFPDSAERLLSGSVNLRRLRRLGASAGLQATVPQDESATVLTLLEELGRRWYHLAWSSLVPAHRGPLHVLEAVAERFQDARRILNLVTDRYLFPYRDQWFPRAS
jgi:hypothetical protein